MQEWLSAGVRRQSFLLSRAMTFAGSALKTSAHSAKSPPKKRAAQTVPTDALTFARVPHEDLDHLQPPRLASRGRDRSHQIRSAIAFVVAQAIFWLMRQAMNAYCWAK